MLYSRRSRGRIFGVDSEEQVHSVIDSVCMDGFAHMCFLPVRRTLMILSELSAASHNIASKPPSEVLSTSPVMISRPSTWLAPLLP